MILRALGMTSALLATARSPSATHSDRPDAATAGAPIHDILLVSIDTLRRLGDAG